MAASAAGTQQVEDDGHYMPAWLEPDAESGMPIHPRQRAAGRSRPAEEQVPEFGATELMGEIDCKLSPPLRCRRRAASRCLQNGMQNAPML